MIEGDHTVRYFFKCSRWLHKQTGLIFLAYFAVMGVSGTLLNHPQWIETFSISSLLTPSSHQLNNGRRMAIRDSVIDGDNIYIAGRAGVWHSSNNGQEFKKLSESFPQTSYSQESYCLQLDPGRAQGRPAYLLAGTRAGVLSYDFKSRRWSQIPFGDTTQPVVDIVQADQHFLVITADKIFRTQHTTPPFELVETQLEYGETVTAGSTPLRRLMLQLHDGSLFGGLGIAIVDICGGLLFFLSLSGLLIWYLPRRNRRSRKRKIFLKLSWWYRNHLKLGIYAALFIALITLTGMLIRPPFISLIRDVNIANQFLWLNNPPRIDKGLYHAPTQQLYIATRKGIFVTSALLDRPLQLDDNLNAIPISSMGVTAFKAITTQQLLMASFRGAYVWNTSNHTLDKLPSEQQCMVTSAVIDKGQLHSLIGYNKGLTTIEGYQQWNLPEAFNNTPMSLWHWLFELHNGRLFRQWLGHYTGWIIPLGGLLLLLNLFSGCFDWWWHRQRR